MRNSVIATLILVTASARGLAAADDLTIVSKNAKDGKATANTTSYLGSDHVRMAQGEGNEIIMDAQSGVMTTLDDKKKTYYTTTKQDLQQMSAKVAAMMNDPKMQQGMQMMQKMAGAMAQSYEVTNTGVTRQVAGFSCVEWTISMAGMSTTKECLTTALQFPAHALDAFKELSQSMQQATSAFGPMAKAGAGLAEKRKAMKGFPVATSSTTEIMGMKSSLSTEVIEVHRGPIPASTWEIPAGYTQVENPMLKALERHSHAPPAG